MEGGMAAGKVIGKGAKAAAKYATEKTALKNAYKLNPLAFKANPEAYYRMIGEGGYADALESGVVRPPIGLGHTEAYYNKGYPLDTRFRNATGRAGYEGPYMAEVKGNKDLFVDENTQGFTGPMFDDPVVYSKAPISTSNPNVKLYKEDWLKRYKEVPKPKSSINNIGTELESEISKLKQKEVLAEESRKNLWADYKAGKITGEEYTIGAKKLNPTPFDNPRHKLEQQLREHKVKQDIINTPQQNILKSESQLGKNISDGGSNTKGVFELGDDYVARLSAHGYDDASRLINYTDKIKSPRISKTLQVKEIDGKVYQVQEKATGTPITKLSIEDYKNIPKQHIDNFWKDKTELDKLGLSIDISGGKSNVFYNKNKGFQFIDLGIGKNESNKVISETLKLPKSNSGWLNKYK
jgi:hypothetical protein